LYRITGHSTSTPNSLPKTDFWTKYSVFLLYCFYLLGKVAVVLAGPLVILLIFNRALCQRVFSALTRRTPLTGLTWLMLLSVMFGICELVYGILQGYKPLLALEVLLFNLCPLYMFVGIWAGEHRPSLIRSFVRFAAWYNAIYATLFFLFLNNLHSDFIGNPGSGSILLLGLFLFESNLKRFWFPILVCSFTTVANQIRADWVGFGVALVVWGVVAKKLGRVVSVAGIVLALLAIGFIFDVRLPALPGRGGELSARDTVGRVLSSIAPDLAREYSPTASTYAGTVQWRQTWWKAIRETVAQDYSTLIFGMGYGYPIADLVPYLRGTDLRTPHSVFYFALAYSGCLGVLLFFSLQIAIFRLLWKTYKITGQIYGFLVYLTLFVSSFFGFFFEAPQSVLPIYILMGMCIGSQFNAGPQPESLRQPARNTPALYSEPVLTLVRNQSY
jgi:O-Antigen ligase